MLVTPEKIIQNTVEPSWSLNLYPCEEDSVTIKELFEEGLQND